MVRKAIEKPVKTKKVNDKLNLNISTINTGRSGLPETQNDLRANQTTLSLTNDMIFMIAWLA